MVWEIEMRAFWKNVAEPVIGRAGTAIGFTLVGWGVAEPHANMIGVGMAAAVFVGVDLIVRRIGGEK